MKENIIVTKSEYFSIKIIKLYKYLCFEEKEYVLSKQILKSGTSIGANINEAVCGVSKNDFLSKMYISFKECNETMYWLRLLFRSDYIDINDFNSLTNDCLELRNILSSITKSTSENIKINS